MITPLEMVAMRRQCGNSGHETPGNPRAMLRFGNHRKIKGLHKDTGLGLTKAGRNTLRGLIHSQKSRLAKSRAALRMAPVEPRESIPNAELALREMNPLRSPHRTIGSVTYEIVR